MSPSAIATYLFCLPYSMPRRALSATKKAQVYRHEHDHLMARAVALYHHELAKPPSEKRAGLRTICKIMEKEYYKETKQSISLNHNTLRNLANGGYTKAKFNSEKSWVTPDETEQVIKFVIEMADLGCPLSHRRLKEHIDMIL